MRLLALFTALFPLCSFLAHAQYQQFSVQEVASVDGTSQTVNVSSSSPTNMTSATSSGTISGAFSVEIYNLAASTSTINCGFDTSVSTTSSSALYGREIPAGVGVVWQVRVPTNKNIFCLTQNTGGITRATVTQLK